MIASVGSVEKLLDPLEDASVSSVQALESPRLFQESMGIFKSFPSLSFDSGLGDDEDPQEPTLEGVNRVIQDFHQRFSKLKTKWSHAFTAGSKSCFSD
jgi:hypothetical protein